MGEPSAGASFRLQRLHGDRLRNGSYNRHLHRELFNPLSSLWNQNRVFGGDLSGFGDLIVNDDGSFADFELRDRLEKAIAQLPEQYRFLIAAHHLRGVQYEALAEALNVPLGTVKTHLHRAKRRLRELLTES